MISAAAISDATTLTSSHPPTSPLPLFVTSRT
jgi:hypothetical protein